MKPTQIECAKGSLNQICPETTVSGDIRLSPFYEVEDVKDAIERCALCERTASHGPRSLVVRLRLADLELPTDLFGAVFANGRTGVKLRWRLLAIDAFSTPHHRQADMPPRSMPSRRPSGACAADMVHLQARPHAH